MVNQITYKFFIIMLLIISPAENVSSIHLNINHTLIENKLTRECDSIMTEQNTNIEVGDTIKLDGLITREEEPHYDYGLNNKRDISTFIKYIKTQSNRLNTLNGEKDVYFVMQTILNRCKHKKCTWRQYYNNPKLNQSQSIKRMRNGSLRKSFNPNDKRDKILLKMLLECKYGTMKGIYRIKSDKVLFFESFKRPPNRGPHLMRNFYVKARHRFYTCDLPDNIDTDRIINGV